MLPCFWSDRKEQGGVLLLEVGLPSPSFLVRNDWSRAGSRILAGIGKGGVGIGVWQRESLRCLLAGLELVILLLDGREGQRRLGRMGGLYGSR